jgi:hypothetical protein
MTQAEFAGRFGFSIDTLRHWEQGRRVPEGPARAYLRVITRDPKAVQKRSRRRRSVRRRGSSRSRDFRRQACKIHK